MTLSMLLLVESPLFFCLLMLLVLVSVLLVAFGIYKWTPVQKHQDEKIRLGNEVIKKSLYKTHNEKTENTITTNDECEHVTVNINNQ